MLHKDQSVRLLPNAEAPASDIDSGDDLENGPGVLQLLLKDWLQTRLGRKFVDESDLLTLLITHGFVRRAHGSGW
jgi:hypothetical protein